MRGAVVVLLIACGVIPAWCQALPAREVDVSRLAEELIGTPDNEEEFEGLYEALLQLLSKPVHLNHTDRDELLAHGMLSAEQVSNLMQYRNDNGALLSIYELQAVPGFTPDVIERIAPFVVIPDPAGAIDRSLVTRIRKDSDNYLLMRISRAWDARAEDQAKYSGSPEHMLIRFRSQRPGDFSFGLHAEKDSGEPLRWSAGDRYYGFDRWGFHAQLQNKGIVRNLVVGDFQAQFGQGLMLGGAFGPGKGSETITTMRRVNAGIVPYTSVYEAGNMRGAATTLQLLKHIDVSVFYSRTRRDAALEEREGKTIAASIQRSGLHRTATELRNRQQLSDTQAGCVVHYKQGNLETGLMFMHSAFGAALAPKPTPYNQFAFRGTTLINAGAFLNYNLGRFAVFGEFATAARSGSAFVFGALGTVTRKLDVAALIRRYDRDFHTRFSNAISENSVPVNEHGIYLGWRYQFNRRIALTGYADLFKFPWLRFRAYAPSSGYEWLGRLTYQPTRNVLVFIQAREEYKLRNAGDGTMPLYTQVPGTKNNYWFHVEAGLRDKVRLRTRLLMSALRSGAVVTRGLALSQDIRADIGRLQVTARFALFDTDDYDNRLYSYENDVLFAYAMPAYNGMGVRRMVMVRYNLSRHLTLWIRYAQTTTTEPENTSANATLVSHVTDREIKVQLRLQF